MKKLNFKWEILYRHYGNINGSFKAWKQITEKLESYSLDLFEKIRIPPDMDAVNQNIPMKKKLEILFQNISAEWQRDDYETLVQSYRKSGVLTVYSNIESHLKALTEEVQSTFDFKLKISDLNNHDYINQCIKYLEKVYELNPSSFQPFLTKIQQNKIIRNKIAHNNNIFTQEDISRISNVKGIDIQKISENRYGLTIHSSLIDDLILISESFFLQLLLAIDERYVKLKS